MSDKTSKTILELDKKLIERRKQEGIETTTPFNYDTTIDYVGAVERSTEASPEKVAEINKELVQKAIEANVPKTDTSISEPKKENKPIMEAATIDTSAIAQTQEKNEQQKRGDDHEEEDIEK